MASERRTARGRGGGGGGVGGGGGGHDIGESKADCEALTSVDERQQCEDQFARNYETYQQERAAL